MNQSTEVAKVAVRLAMSSREEENIFKKKNLKPTVLNVWL